MADDYTGSFNTPLNDAEQMSYDEKWGDKAKADLFDYDLQGFHKDNPDYIGAPGQHLTDEFKKPNHPTFSDESKYHGVSSEKHSESDDPNSIFEGKKYEGGHWEMLENNKFAFTPGSTNFEHHSTQDMIDYFKKVEPNNYLVLPGS